MNSMEGENDLIGSIVANGDVQANGTVKFELKFAKTIGSGLRNLPLPFLNADGNACGHPVHAFAGEDLPYQTGAIGFPARFQAKVDVVVIRLIQKLSGRNRTSNSRSYGL
jgi:hypothetical protein